MLTVCEERELDEVDGVDGAEAAEAAPVAEISSGTDFAVFDIETGPLDDEALLKPCPPFVAPAHPGEFDPAAVRYGNTKDADKRAAKLKEEQDKHAAAVKDYDATVGKARDEWFGKFKASAALDATTGRVVAIGMALDVGIILDCDGDKEAEGLRRFWDYVATWLQMQMPMLGFNIIGFDLPFLVRRSWILGVPVPHGVRQGRYWNPLFVDLLDVFRLGSRDFISLNNAAKAFGIEGKVEEVDGVVVSGATFYQLWRTNRKVAEQYLLADLRVPAELARKMGVV